MNQLKVNKLVELLEEASGKKVVLKENLETSDDVRKFVGFLINQSGLRDSLASIVKDIFEQDMNIESQAIKTGLLKAIEPLINELVSRRSRSMNK